MTRLTAILTNLVAAGITGSLLVPALVSAEDGTLIDDEENAENLIAAGVWTSEDGAKVTYEASFFEPYQTVNAADMLRWVPGGSAVLPDNQRRGNQPEKRGFGSGGDQVLINGKRISGKSNDISSAMQRIQASLVSHIEVIRGTTAGLDVRSEGTLFNVVLTEEISGGSGNWQLHSGFYGESAEYDGLVSYSNSRGKMNYLISAELGPYNRGSEQDRYEEYFAPGSSTPFEMRDINEPELKQELVLNASGGWAFDNGDHLNLNFRAADKEEDKNETTIVTTVGNPDTENLLNRSVEDGFEWEVGGDMENRMGPDGTLKTRLIYTDKSGDESEFVSLTSTFPGNVPSESLVLTDERSTESIIRSGYSWPLTISQNLELGIEGAINTLEKDVQLFEVLPDGSLDPIDVFNSNSDVEENRYEFFSTHFWQIREDIALESALNLEYSKIEQTGIDVNNARSFTYVKPRFDFRWDIDDATQFRTSLERTVSQLDFGDFVANFDDDDDSVDAGNPDLEPEKAWEYKVTFERRLNNDNGVLEAQLYYNDIEDHIDKVAATEVISSPGNIGDATHYGVDLKGSLRLSTIGIDGAVIDVTYRWQDSETTDPFTGEERVMRFKPNNRYSIRFSHDIAPWNLNYRVDVDWWGEREQHDITFRDVNDSLNANINASIQYRLTDNLLLWFDSRFVVDSHHQRTRERFVGNIANNIPLRTEVRDQYRRSEYIVGFRGQF
ncbi:MAG: TonB-dependent receptor [Phycisphaerae bacterium]|nr:MAG: TonB-dependent receptor [Phycisphaerae bacterium]